MSTPITVGDVASRNQVTADPQFAHIPVVVQTPSGKVRNVTDAHFNGRELVLVTSK